MRRLFLLLLILLSAIICMATPVVIPITTIGPYLTLVSNQPWTSSGNPGFNNIFTFTPISPNIGVCINVNNLNFSGTNDAQIDVFQTNDPSSIPNDPDYSTKWVHTNFFYVNSTNTIPPGNGPGSSRQLQYLFQAGGAARIAVRFASGSGTGNVGVTISQSQYGCGIRYTVPVYCRYSTSVVIPTGTTVKVVSNDGSGFAVHVCSFDVTIAGATIAAASNTFTLGTGATCGSGVNIVEQFANGTTPFLLVREGAGNEFWAAPFINSESAFQVAAGQSLCYTDGGTTAGTDLNITWDIF
jgi:hypothetical protein